MGALHGMLNAEALAAILNDLFGGVVYAGIDTDKHKYPIGECPTSMGKCVAPGRSPKIVILPMGARGKPGPGLQMDASLQQSVFVQLSHPLHPPSPTSREGGNTQRQRPRR